MFSDESVAPFFARLREQLPGLEVLDVHTHIGFNDPDGVRCSPEQLRQALDTAGARSVVFAMHEPGGYPAANDWVREEAERAGGRLVSFARLDPRDHPVREAERSLDAGSRGLKLHPRAEGFALDERCVEPIVALAQERSVPLIVHAGRGIPALGRHAVELCRGHSGARVILAHAGICDLAWIWREARELPNLFFDTSWWSASDLLALLSLVPPGQVLLASDAPYGSPALGSVLTLRCALQAGLSEEAVRSIAGGQTRRLLDGLEPLDLGPAVEAVPERDLLLDRVGTFLTYALGQALQGVHPTEAIDLARLACEVGDETPQAAVCRAVLALLENTEDLPPDPDRPSRFMPVLPRLVLAGLVVRTPDVALPGVETPVDVAARPKGLETS
ncbi:MAG: amidohydrolase family protein [Actinomycetota bacterium]|nr:amidohydrolase family protein [Actinomycetota bacterium]